MKTKKKIEDISNTLSLNCEQRFWSFIVPTPMYSALQKEGTFS